MFRGFNGVGALGKVFIGAVAIFGACMIYMTITGDLGDRLDNVASMFSEPTEVPEAYAEAFAELDCKAADSTIRAELDRWRIDPSLGAGYFPASLETLQTMPGTEVGPEHLSYDWDYRTDGVTFAMNDIC